MYEFFTVVAVVVVVVVTVLTHCFSSLNYPQTIYGAELVFPLLAPSYELLWKVQNHDSSPLAETKIFRLPAVLSLSSFLNVQRISIYGESLSS